MTIVAEKYVHIIGVDTHARTHTYAILSSATGQITETATFPTSPPDIARAMAWMDRRTVNGKALVSIEGASSYGAGLTRTLLGAGTDVCDVRPPRRKSPRGKGKSDAIDAAAAAQTVLGIDVLSLLRPRADGDHNALRILLNARRSTDSQRTADRLALTALARTTAVGIDARKALTDTQIRTISAWRQRAHGDRADAVARAEARRLALAVVHFTAELEDNKTALAEIVADMAPGLLDVPGVGPVTSAVILTAYSHHGRIRSEAAFAALAGVNPIPASLRHNRPAPAQPAWGPATEPGPGHHHPKPHEFRPQHAGLCRTTDPGREDPPRDPPLPQTHHRPAALPQNQRHHALTQPIEGSVGIDTSTSTKPDSSGRASGHAVSRETFSGTPTCTGQRRLERGALARHAHPFHRLSPYTTAWRRPGTRSSGHHSSTGPAGVLSGPLRG